MLLPALFLLLLEGGLRVAGFGAPASFTVPCEVQGRKARCENPGFTDPFFPPGMARRATSFVIPEEKGPRTFRIFVVGESAALGDPEPTFGFSRFLEAMLRERFPDRDFEVINTGVVAVNSHVLLPIVRDLARRGGDLFLVYAGNNEVVGPFGSGTVFSRRLPRLWLIRASILARGTRIGQLLARLGARDARAKEWGGMEMFLDRQVRADDPGMEAVYANFEANLRDMMDAARGSGAKVLVSTVGTRLRGFAPFASAHRRGLAADALAAWTTRVERGARDEAEGRPAEALAEYRAAEALDGEFAELQYRLGRVALALGDFAGARERLVRARDLDTLRFRADTRIDGIIRKVAGAQLIDGAAALDQGSPHGIPGGELFYEHAHLTPEGNYLLARAFFPGVAAALQKAAEPPREEACVRRLALTGFDRYRVAKEVLRRLSRPPFAGQLDHEGQVAEAERARDQGAREEFQDSDAAYRAAIALNGADPWLHYNYGILLDTRDVFLARRGGPDQGRAIGQYQQVLQLLPQDVLARFRLAEALLRTGRPDEAIAHSREILRTRTRYGPAWQTLGRALAAKGRAGESRAALERAAALMPPPER